MVSARMILNVEILELQFGRENTELLICVVFFGKLLL